MRLLLNTKPYLRSTRLETWGQWLDLLDADGERSGRIVTAVRFDSVDEPAFRAARLRDRRLDQFETIEVDSAARQTFLAETAQQGALMVTSLADAATSVGDAYRQDNLASAQTLMPQLIDGIRQVISLTDECAAALGVPRQRIVCRGIPFDEWMGEFGRRLAVLIDAQASEDWLTTADSLEYEIAPALREWVAAFQYLESTAVESS